MPRFNKMKASRHLAIILAAASLAGCSEYLDRTDTMSRQSGNAIQTEKLTQMVDPWPVASAERNIAFDGAVMEAGMTRYRTGRVIQPRGLNSSGNAASNNAQPSPNSAPLGPTVNSQSGPVK
ncbi:MAG: hypothetical protein JSR72_13220 [Proteobacteria bacterium]|nr:hypothetical protein [Pseudomonadota bacterium]